MRRNFGQICKCCNGRDSDCRLIAKTVLKNLTVRPTIKCSGSVKREFYMIGSCEAGGFDLSHNTGWALVTEPYSAGNQTQAKKKKYGLWKGNLDTPWVWHELQKQR